MPEKKERFGQGILSMALANFDSWVHSPRTVLMLLFIIAICYLQMCGYKMTLNETGYTMHMGETLFYEFNFGCNMPMTDNSGKYKPLIVAFCCNWCSYAGADLAGSNRLGYPADVKIIRVPCSCRVNPMFILRAFQRGADGVIICGCHPGDCHYTSGNYYTRRRMALLFSMLDYLGIERERTRVEWVSAAEGAKFAATMNDFAEKVAGLGKNKRLEDLRCSK